MVSKKYIGVENHPLNFLKKIFKKYLQVHCFMIR